MDWREKQIRKITDKVYDRLINQSERVSATLTFEDLYVGVLFVFNDLNKRLPGPHFDPPSRDEVRAIIQECDINLDGELNSEEFVKFIERITGNTFITASQGLILTLVVAPTVAVATEGVPGVVKVVQKIPNSIYASIITRAIVLFQKSQLDADY